MILDARFILLSATQIEHLQQLAQRLLLHQLLSHLTRLVFRVRLKTQGGHQCHHDDKEEPGQQAVHFIPKTAIPPEASLYPPGFVFYHDQSDRHGHVMHHVAVNMELFEWLGKRGFYLCQSLGNGIDYRI